MKKEAPRVVVLAGPELWNRNTCATLISAGLNVVGLCFCDQRSHGLPLATLKHAVKRRGLVNTLGQIAGRIVYLGMNRSKDRKILRRLLDLKAIDRTISNWNGPIFQTEDYGSEDCIRWLKSLEPDIFVAHTKYWIGKKVREIPKTGMVIGGHPGLVPDYRGSHSPFWAIYKSHPEDVGCSVFLIGDGVDTGDLIARQRIPIEEGDSYFTLSWKAMARIAKIQAGLISDYGNGIPIKAVKQENIPPDSEYPVPALWHYLMYRLRQREVR